MTSTLLFYKISQRFGDDQRLIAQFIFEALQPEKIYKDLLNGHFDKYAILLNEITKNKSDECLDKWCKEKKCSLFSMGELWQTEDFEKFEVKDD